MKFSTLNILLFWVALLTSLPLSAQTVEIVPDDDSRFSGITHSCTLPDGSKLAFHSSYYHEIDFLGAIGCPSSELTVPEQLTILDTKGEDVGTFPMVNCDASVLPGIESLRLPPTTIRIQKLPETVKYLHLTSYVDPFYAKYCTKQSRVYVSEDVAKSYYDNEEWNRYTHICLEGYEPVPCHLHISQPGTLAQSYLELGIDWDLTYDLTVTGKLSYADLELFKRFNQLEKLDLSGAEFAAIPAKFSATHFQFLETLKLPVISSIGTEAFYDTPRLKNIELAGVDSLRTYAFESCGMEHITLPPTLHYMEKSAFKNCKALKNITLPEGMTVIPTYCFFNCTVLKDVVLPESLQEIGSHAFENTALEKINIPGQVKNIGEYAFQNCENLAEVQLNPGIEKIYRGCFYNCNALPAIRIPGTLRSIGANTFGKCTALKDISVYSYSPPLHTSWDTEKIMSDCDLSDVRVHVPEAAIPVYRNNSTVSAAKFIKSVNPEIVIMADNCYGEFLETKEPTDVGVDVMAGSLIKNPGGGLALAG